MTPAHFCRPKDYDFVAVSRLNQPRERRRWQIVSNVLVNPNECVSVYTKVFEACIQKFADLVRRPRTVFRTRLSRLSRPVHGQRAQISEWSRSGYSHCEKTAIRERNTRD